MRYLKYLPGGFIVETPDMVMARIIHIYDEKLSPYFQAESTYSDGWSLPLSSDAIQGWEEISIDVLHSEYGYACSDDNVADDKDFKSSVLAITHYIALMLIEKNEKYGNSALEPIRIFSKASAEEQILVRIDDKLSRIKNASELEDEDVISDLIGYLVLLKLKRSENVCSTEA